MERTDPFEDEERPPGATSGEERAPDLAADLRELGENLRETLRVAWQSAERERLQAEIEQGLRSFRHAVGEGFEQASQSLRDREALRQRVTDVRHKASELRDELRPARVAERMQVELHQMLQRFNEELRRSRERWTPAGGAGDPGTEGPAVAAEEPPSPRSEEAPHAPGTDDGFSRGREG